MRVGCGVIRIREARVSLGVNVRLIERCVVDEDFSITEHNSLTWQPDDALDITFRRVVGEPEDDDVAACELRDAVVDQLVDENPFAVMQVRLHRSAFDLNRLHDEDDQKRGEHQSKQQVARKQTRFRPEAMARDIARLLYLYIFVIFGCDSAKQRRMTFLESEHSRLMMKDEH